jgi:hypothetical protein
MLCIRCRCTLGSTSASMWQSPRCQAGCIGILNATHEDIGLSLESPVPPSTPMARTGLIPSRRHSCRENYGEAAAIYQTRCDGNILACRMQRVLFSLSGLACCTGQLLRRLWPCGPSCYTRRPPQAPVSQSIIHCRGLTRSSALSDPLQQGRKKNAGKSRRRAAGRRKAWICCSTSRYGYVVRLPLPIVNISQVAREA